jgi:hypothetical protein
MYVRPTILQPINMIFNSGGGIDRCARLSVDNEVEVSVIAIGSLNFMNPFEKTAYFSTSLRIQKMQ